MGMLTLRLRNAGAEENALNLRIYSFGDTRRDRNLSGEPNRLDHQAFADEIDIDANPSQKQRHLI
jgi:hypothetical protein